MDVEVEMKASPNVGVTTLLGRICITILFLLSGFGKIMDPAGTQAYIASKGLPIVAVLYVLAVVFELAGSLSVLLGIKARWGAAMLLIFTLVAGTLFHNFWALPTEQAQGQMIHFLKNVSIVGGLFYVIAFGAGPISFDHRRTVVPDQ